jgi:hypothetical protein
MAGNVAADSLEAGILSFSMTKVTLHYDLIRPLTDDDLPKIANVHSTYGLARVQIAPSLDRITVDYDASRLTRTDVESALIRHGLPIHTIAQTAA